MENFISAISSAISGIFTAIVTAFSDIGSLIFKISEAGEITGVASFGYFLAVLIGIPLGTYLFSQLLGLIKRLAPGGSRR